MKLWAKLPLAVVMLLVLAACRPTDARAIWKDGIKKCATTDLIGPDVLYFGPSNTLGPGTVFERFSTGGIQESHLLPSYINPPDPVISPNPGTFACTSDRAAKMNLSAEVPLDAVLPIGAAAAAHLKKARSVKVWADELQWVALLTGPYKEKVIALPATHTVRKDLEAGHLVLSRALRVKGLKAELEFSSDVGADVKAAVPSVSGAKDIKLGGAWDGTTKLTISAASDFFIAGELREWKGGLSAADEVGPPVRNAGSLIYKSKQ